MSDESDEASDYDERFHRRKRRVVSQRQVNYHEVSDTESDSKQEPTTAPVACRKAVLSTRRIKISDSDYQPSSDDQNDAVVVSDNESPVQTTHKRLGLDSDNSGSEAVTKKKGRLNRIVLSSDSGESEKEDTVIDLEKPVVERNGSADSPYFAVNGKSSCNSESLNNRSFAIANLIKTTAVSSPSQNMNHSTVSDSDEVEAPVMIDDDSLSGIDDIVNYVTQS